MRKELIIFNPSIEDGGVEKNLFLISNYFVNHNIKTSIISADASKKNKFDRKVNFIFPKITNFQNSGRYKKYFYCLLLLAKRIFFKENFVVFSFQANIYSIILSKLFGTKIIVRMNTAPQGWDHNFIKKKIYKFFIKKADGIIVNSKIFQKEVKKRFNVKPIFINNPFDFTKIKKLSDLKSKNFYKNNTLKLLTVGRLTEQKDHLTILKSMKILNNTNVNFQLLIIGKGNLESFLKNYTRNNNLSKKVKFLGYKKNPYPFMSKSEIFILSSLYEGSPNVLIEALFLKNKVISSNCPTGPKEILMNEKNSLMFKIRDHKDLAKKIIFMSNNPGIKKINKTFFDKYDNELICNQYKNYVGKFLI